MGLSWGKGHTDRPPIDEQTRPPNVAGNSSGRGTDGAAQAHVGHSKMSVK